MLILISKYNGSHYYTNHNRMLWRKSCSGGLTVGGCPTNSLNKNLSLLCPSVLSLYMPLSTAVASDLQRCVVQRPRHAWMEKQQLLLEKSEKCYWGAHSLSAREQGPVGQPGRRAGGTTWRFCLYFSNTILHRSIYISQLIVQHRLHTNAYIVSAGSTTGFCFRSCAAM